jgi:hypothetical protein
MPDHKLEILPDGRLRLTSAHTISNLPLILEGALHLAADYIESVDGKHSDTGYTTTEGRMGISFALRFLAELVPDEYQMCRDRRTHQEGNNRA